jgi:sugar/nucleoside kinase (ribokinase family)
LYAYTQGTDLKTAGKLGGAMAAQVISQYGPRAEKAEILKLKASVL